MRLRYSVITNLVILASLAWAPALAFGAPNVQSVTTDQADGQTLIITGSNFDSAEFPIILDTADDWQVVQQNDSYSTLSPSELWSEEGSAWATPLEVVSGTGPLGEQSNRLYYGKRKSYNRYFTPFQDENNNSLYVSWWFKPSESPNAAGGSNKFIRIWDDDGGNNTRISWTNMHLTYSTGDLGLEGVEWGTWSGDENKWNLMEIYVDSSNNSIRTWVNGDLLHNVKDFRKSPINKGLNAKLIGFDPSVSDPYQNLEFQIDNIYVSKEPTRVVASLHKTWDRAKSEHLALFPKKWTATRIHVDAEEILDDGRSYYLYVVDQSGAANTNGVTLCPKCPARIELRL